MDRKSLVVGAVFGALAYAGVSALLFNSERPIDSEFSAQFTEQGSGDANVPRSAESVVQVSDPAAPAPQVDALPTPPPAASAQTVSSSEPQNFYLARRAALMEEPKDASWAYFTEQAVLQYLTSHPLMAKFSLDYIECRTTECLIGVEAYDESANPDWQRIIHDMREQPWYAFGQVGTSNGELDGRQMGITSLRRLSDD